MRASSSTRNGTSELGWRALYPSGTDLYSSGLHEYAQVLSMMNPAPAEKVSD
jgi:hypothetical protein